MTRKGRSDGWGFGIGFHFMFEENLREGRGEVKGDERSNVAISVDTGTISGGAEVVPGRRAAKCGDPQAYFRNWC
ncbi:hypothetical protein PM8797T_07524 [Gimesia maris DSM 8797]|nr:hypothetical protein PM8797T_07524 [Gimesia maris DSM 8797]